MVLSTPLMCWWVPVLVEVVAHAAVVVVLVCFGLSLSFYMLPSSCFAPLDVL